LTPEQFEKVRALFAEAVSRPAHTRREFLLRSSCDDEEVLQEVIALLSHESAEDALEGLHRAVISALAAPGATSHPGEEDRAESGERIVGETVSHYKILAEIGRGGMGIVYRALDVKLNREVAFKVLPPELVSDKERKRRFVHEAQAAAAMNHPNICTIHEIGESDGQDYISFELIEGRRLDELTKTGDLPQARLIEWALALAEALAYAHGKGIVHRDLKPSNVMVSNLGIPKILDFGLALSLRTGVAESEGETRLRLTGAGVLLGTMGFMSPEQALGEPVDARTDVFSFGVLLYEMATGRPAFSGATAAQTLNAIVNQEPEPMERFRPDLPPRFSRLVAKALRKHPEERYQRMEDLAAELRNLDRAADRSGGAAARDGAPRALRHPRWWQVAVGTLSVLLLAALLVYRWQGSIPTEATRDPVAVMPFENLADPEDRDNLGRMTSTLLATELSQWSVRPVVSSQRLHDAASELGKAGSPRGGPEAREVARLTGAHEMVTGKVERVGEQLVVTSELVEVETGELLGVYRADARGLDDVFALAEALGRDVVADLVPSGEPGRFGTDLASFMTRSVDAYRAYSRGEAHLERGDYASAAVEFSKAVQLDYDFALAYYRLAWAAGFAGDTTASQRASARAIGFANRLPASYQDVARGAALYFSGAQNAMEPLEAALRKEPENTDALLLLAECYYHSARDNDPERAAKAYEGLRSADRHYQGLYREMAETYAVSGALDQAEEALATMEARWPEAAHPLRAWLMAFAGRHEEALEQIELTSIPSGVPNRQAVGVLAREVVVFSEVAMLNGRWELAEKLVSRDVPLRPFWRRSPVLRARGHFFVYRGRFDRAIESYLAAIGTDPLTEDDLFRGGVQTTALRSLATLRALQGDAEGALRELARALAIQPQSPRNLYFAGRQAAMGGDVAEARRHLSELERLLPTTQHTMRDLYRDALEAEVALAEGRADSARAVSERVSHSPRRLLDFGTDNTFACAPFRDTLARAHLALGDKAGAVRVLEELVESGLERVHFPVLYVRALYTLGKLELEMGERALGRRHLQQFLDHWDGADWELSEVVDARRLLARG
jgi:tetratricopeptide (TPR) repeat protein